MKIAITCFSLIVLAMSVNAQTERQILVTPNAEHPQIAKDSGLGGTVRVVVVVDQAGNVVSVGGATGPGNICPSVTRADVVALRDSAKAAAVNAKFAASEFPNPSTMYLSFDFPMGKKFTAPVDDAASYVGPVTKEDGSTSKQLGKNERFTIKGDRDYSAVSPPDYTGPAVSGSSSGTPTPGANSKQISGGVLNGKAMSLPKPPFPPAARAVRASGAVSVQVLIYEDGNVFSAAAISGHPLLRAAARTAACGAVFSPTYLEGNPVKVSGVITYNFVP